MLLGPGSVLCMIHERHVILKVVLHTKLTVYAPINVRPSPHPGQGGEFSLFGMAGLPQGSGY